MANNGISGTAVAVTTVGGVLLYSAVKNRTVSETVRSFLQGKTLPDAPGGVNASGSGGSFPAGATGSGNARTISGFLGQYFKRAAIAGILGNMSVESNFSPTAYNANEGAIGLCQWEGGRRVALQAYARAHDVRETDLSAQLGYLMLELHSGFAHVYAELMAVPDSVAGARMAAAIFDAQYEISSGSARAERVSRAEQWYGSLGTSGRAA